MSLLYKFLLTSTTYMKAWNTLSVRSTLMLMRGVSRGIGVREWGWRGFCGWGSDGAIGG